MPEQIEQPTFTPRPVLSFVRRSGRLDARLQRAWDNYADTYLLDINAGEGSLDVRDDFTLDRDTIAVTWGNANPLIVEIGTGQGENIVAAAAAHPDVNFLALEVYDPGVAHTLLLAGKQRLGNLRIAQVNAPELLAATAPGSIAEVWTFFPDPWPKMKHHKRRIVQPQLAQSVHGALADGGAWRIATDIEDYALHVHEVMDGRTDFRDAGGYPPAPVSTRYRGPEPFVSNGFRPSAWPSAARTGNRAVVAATKDAPKSLSPSI